MTHLVCLGLGFTARPFAERLAKQGWRITGTCRSAAASLPLPGGAAIVEFDGDGASPALAAALAEATHVLVSIPPDETGEDPVLRALHACLAAAPKLVWIGYLSTVGIYGDRRGAWVSETDAPQPRPGRSQRRAMAEEAWLDAYWQWRLPVHTFRLAGIYGPGRSAFDALKAGTARRIVKIGQVFNRIHVDDIGGVLLASMQRPRPGAIYNVADDEPAPPQDVIAYAAGLIGAEPPPLIPFEAAQLSPMARSFYLENKRIDNTRIKSELGVQLAYPSYREGLAAVLNAGHRA